MKQAKRCPRIEQIAIVAISVCLVGCQPKPAPTASLSNGNSTEASQYADARNSVPGPVEGTRITEAYARMVARDAYFWAWPMVNIYNRRLAFSKAPEPGIMNALPFAPLNRLVACL